MDKSVSALGVFAHTGVPRASGDKPLIQVNEINACTHWTLFMSIAGTQYQRLLSV
jgi:hypothetical protein